jgi:hypothetical protein
MSISNNAELYAAVDTLRTKLQAAGEMAWSTALHEALYISTVPGEVLGETRHQLTRLLYSSITDQLQLREIINESLAYLNKILDSPLR